MLEGLIFDVDGTVAETEHMHLRAFNLAFSKHRLDMAWDAAGYRHLLRVAGCKERIAVALATTTSDENLDPLFVPVMGLAWRTRFAAVVTGAMVVRKKPAPDAHLEALRRMGIPASRAVAFEDSANGVMAASSAGLAVVATPSAWLTEDESSGADMLLEQGLHDLPSIQFLASWHRDRRAACNLRA